MSDKAIYSVDTVASVNDDDKVYVNTGDNIKQVKKSDLLSEVKQDISQINSNLTSQIHHISPTSTKLFEIYNSYMSTVIANGYNEVTLPSKEWITLGNTNKIPYKDIGFPIYDASDAKYVGYGVLTTSGELSVYNCLSVSISSLGFSFSFIPK